MGLAHIALNLKRGESFADRRSSCRAGQWGTALLAFVFIASMIAIDVVMVEFGSARHYVALFSIIFMLLMAFADIRRKQKDIRAIDGLLNMPAAPLYAAAMNDWSLVGQNPWPFKK